MKLIISLFTLLLSPLFSTIAQTSNKLPFQKDSVTYLKGINIFKTPNLTLHLNNNSKIVVKAPEGKAHVLFEAQGAKDSNITLAKFHSLNISKHECFFKVISVHESVLLTHYGDFFHWSDHTGRKFRDIEDGTWAIYDINNGTKIKSVSNRYFIHSTPDSLNEISPIFIYQKNDSLVVSYLTALSIPNPLTIGLKDNVNWIQIKEHYDKGINNGSSEVRNYESKFKVTYNTLEQEVNIYLLPLYSSTPELVAKLKLNASLENITPDK